MNDIFDNLEEHHAERLAIMIESKVPDPVGNAAADLHRFEVRDVIRRFFPKGPAEEYFLLVEKKRGALAAKKLRDDCRIEWAAHRDKLKSIQAKNNDPK